MSAIDWLSRTVQTPGRPGVVALPDEKPVAKGAAPAEIVTTTIDGPNPDAIGLLPVSTTGLPRDLWGSSTSEDLARLLREERIDTLPAIQSLLYALLLAELDPPADSDGRGLVYLARIDRLLDLGALDPALSMLAGPAIQAADRTPVTSIGTRMMATTTHNTLRCRRFSVRAAVNRDIYKKCCSLQIRGMGARRR